MSRVAVTALGALQVHRDGEPVVFDRRKTLALFAHLAVTRRAYTRESLGALLWPDAESTQAAANIRHSVWEIGRLVGQGWASTDGGTLAIDPSMGLDVDVHRFRELLGSRPSALATTSRLDKVADAVDLYKGDFLEGFHLRDAPDFDEWRFFEAEGLRRVFGYALRSLSSGLLTLGDGAASLEHARRWLALDPLDEAAQRQVMASLASMGRVPEALRQYRECEETLRLELGTEPQEETTRLYEQLLHQRSQPKPAPPPSQPRLPSSPAPFVGRGEELARLDALLGDGSSRLITITGPGGAGKTRLALQAAIGREATFEDGAAFVSLASLTDSAFIVSAIADALGLPFAGASTLGPGQPGQLEQLERFVADKRLLLVLDNLEHLPGAASIVKALASGGRGLAILVTSTERLGLDGECVLPIEGLPTAVAHDASMSDAAEAFVLAARRNRVGFAPGPEEVLAIEAIGRLVQGMPLSLEIAAAWTSTLTCADIERQIERDIDFLQLDRDDRPARHRSMRAVFEHASRILDGTDATALARLAVFSGPFTREAATAVAGADVRELRRLVEKSLLRREADGRFSLHRTLRRFALERLAANAADASQTEERLSAYFCDFLRARLPSLRGRAQRQAMADIAADLENILAGWRYALAARGDVDPFLEGLGWFHQIRGRIQDAERMFAQGLEDQADASHEGSALAMLWAWHGWFACRVGAFDVGRRHLRTALRMATGSAPEVRRRRAFIGSMCLAAEAIEDPLEAERLADESLAYYLQHTDAQGLPLLLPHLRSRLVARGDLDGARRLHVEALRRHEEVGDLWGRASTLTEYAELLHFVGEFERAEAHHRACLAVATDLDDQWGVSICLDNLGYLARELGRLDEAEQLHLESLAVSRRIGDKLGIAGSLDNLGLVALDAGNPKDATTLLEQAFALRQETGQVGAVGISLEHLGAARLALGELDEAEAALNESMVIARQMPPWALTMHATDHLGAVRVAQGRAAEAAVLHIASLEASLRTGSQSGAARSLAGLAACLAAGGRDARAVATEAAAFVAASPRADAVTRQAAHRVMARTSASLPSAAFARAVRRGEARDLDAVSALVLSHGRALAKREGGGLRAPRRSPARA